MDVLTEDFMLGIQAFKKNEGRDSMYRVATFLLDKWWGDFPKMVDALSVLLLTWNNAFYRYGMFSQDLLENFLSNHWIEIESFHSRDIRSLESNDYEAITNIFMELGKALQRNNKGKITISPVGVAKALHLLAPKFFPIWDQYIATEYDCYYSWKPADSYFRFCGEIQKIAEEMANQDQIKQLLSNDPEKKSLLKRIDEFNYARFTQHWV